MCDPRAGRPGPGSLRVCALRHRSPGGFFIDRLAAALMIIRSFLAFQSAPPRLSEESERPSTPQQQVRAGM